MSHKVNHKAVPTEYTSGSLVGITTPKMRVLMRSADAFIYVAYGVYLSYRINPNYSMSIRLARTATRQEMQNPDIRTKIDSYFGKDAADIVMLAFNVRGKGTVLYDGGGDPLPLPHKEHREKRNDEWSKVTPTQKLFEDFDKCMECGENLHPRFEVHDLGYESKVSTIDECQRLTNHRIIEVTGHGMSERKEKWPFIRSFKTWREGEYWDEFFCSSQCAAAYGRKAAKLAADQKRGSQF